MQIIINIPKDFEEEFNRDKFEDSLQRVRFDIHKAIIAKKVILSGNYEIETLDMLTEEFLNSTPLPKGHGRLLDENKLLENLKESANHHVNNSREESLLYRDRVIVREQPTIIEADKESEDK